MALHGTQHTAGHVGCQEARVRGWSSVPWGVGARAVVLQGVTVGAVVTGT